MNIKDLLKWGNKWETGKMIVIISFVLCLILFMNRYDFLIESATETCLNEHVKFWQTGFLQLLRSFFEHFTFNFLVPIIFVIFSLGFDKLFRKYLNWRISFAIGALFSISSTIIWEFQKRPIEWIEVIYDLSAVLVSYLFIRWMLKEFDNLVKQTSKKEESK